MRARLFSAVLLTYALLFVPLTLLGGALVMRGVMRSYGERSLREAQLVAQLPVVEDALGGDGTAQRKMQEKMERWRVTLHTDFIVVADAEAKRLAHPRSALIGERVTAGNLTAFLRGQSVTEVVDSALGRALVSKAPVFAPAETQVARPIIGFASVGFLLPRLRDVFWQVIRTGALPYLLALLLSLALAEGLSRKLRRELLDLEPDQISGGLLHYHTLLHSLDEGALVLRGRNVYAINARASELLGLAITQLPLPLTPELVAQLGKEQQNVTLVGGGGRPLLVSTRTASDGAWVVTLRDRAEVQTLADELAHSRRYAELLRSQTHEFVNRLQTIAGLLRLGQAEEAQRLIYAQARRQELHLRAIEKLGQVRLAALLLAKAEAAAAQGITLTLDPLSALPAHLPPGVQALLELAVGNLVDNACEAALGQTWREVRVLIGYDPEGIVLEVRDSGPGLPPLPASPTTRGVSSKEPEDESTMSGPTARGVGLALISEQAGWMGAALTWARQTDETGSEWTVFTLDIPADAPRRTDDSDTTG